MFAIKAPVAGTSYIFSFYNIGIHIRSSKTFLLFGVNVKEGLSNDKKTKMSYLSDFHVDKK